MFKFLLQVWGINQLLKLKEKGYIKMEPSQKSPEMNKFLDKLMGRTQAIRNNKCLDPPVGCGKPITEFRDDISRKEYTIGGWCQSCQDRIYGTN